MICHHIKYELYTTNARVTPPKTAQLASWYCWCKIIIYNGRAPFSDMTFTLRKRNGQMKLPIWLQLHSVAMDTPLTVWPNSQVPTLCCLQYTVLFATCFTVILTPVKGCALTICNSQTGHNGLLWKDNEIYGSYGIQYEDHGLVNAYKYFTGTCCPHIKADRTLLQNVCTFVGSHLPHKKDMGSLTVQYILNTQSEKQNNLWICSTRIPTHPLGLDDSDKTPTLSTYIKCF
jgi:hypothetical protein